MLPAKLAEEINAAFEPPAKFSADYGVYVVECSATAPKLGVTIDSHTFWHEAVDLVQKDASTGFCYSLVTPSAEGEGLSVNFLGDAFLRNVVAVFDFGKDEMRFAARAEKNTADERRFFSRQ